MAFQIDLDVLGNALETGNTLKFLWVDQLSAEVGGCTHRCGSLMTPWPCSSAHTTQSFMPYGFVGIASSFFFFFFEAVYICGNHWESVTLILNSKIRKQNTGNVYLTFLNFRIIYLFFPFYVSSEARFQRLSSSSSSSSGQQDFENELVGTRGLVVFVAQRAEGTAWR